MGSARFVRSFAAGTRENEVSALTMQGTLEAILAGVDREAEIALKAAGTATT